jgi:hypothetical protein
MILGQLVGCSATVLPVYWAETLSITTFSIMTLGKKGLYVTLSIKMLCHNAECHYTECRVLIVIMLSVIILMLNVVILGVVALVNN